MNLWIEIPGVSLCPALNLCRAAEACSGAGLVPSRSEQPPVGMDQQPWLRAGENTVATLWAQLQGSGVKEPDDRRENKINLYFKK